VLHHHLNALLGFIGTTTSERMIGISDIH